MNFVDFLKLHYYYGNIKDNDNEKDSELPFKKCETSSFDNVIPSKKIEVDLVPQFSYFKELLSLIVTDFVMCNFCSKIWQPPKI